MPLRRKSVCERLNGGFQVASKGISRDAALGKLFETHEEVEICFVLQISARSGTEVNDEEKAWAMAALKARDAGVQQRLKKR